MLFVLRDDPRIRRVCGFTRYAGLIGAGAGFLSEVIQKPLRRDASWEDVVADAVGVVCALAVYAAVRRAATRLTPLASCRSRWWSRSAASRYTWRRLLGWRAPMCIATPSFRCSANFHSRIELYWIVGYRRQARRSSTTRSRWNSCDEVFPGVSFHEPVPDWRQLQDPGHRRRKIPERSSAAPGRARA